MKSCGARNYVRTASTNIMIVVVRIFSRKISVHCVQNQNLKATTRIPMFYVLGWTRTVGGGIAPRVARQGLGS